jgi:SagB-type dehydrogenase family enzyme
MPPGDTARLYHRLSSYAPEREFTVPIDDPLVLQDFVANDFARWPEPCKTYADELPTVVLPREWPAPATPATAVLAGTAPADPAPLDLATLARLLHLSAGVVRVTEREDRPTLLFRAAGSAGGRFPLEHYVSARGVAGLEDGVHWYDPVGHALRQIGPHADGEATTLVVTGVPWRSAWRYAERAFRHLYWDAGTMLAQALALAHSSGLEPRLRTRFPDAATTRLVGADGTHEFAVALLSFGDGAPAIAPTGEAARGAVDRAPLEFPLVTLVQRAGDGDVLGDPWGAGAPFAGAPAAADLDSVILRRGSTRRMDAGATVPREVLTFSLAAALRGIDVPHFVAVHGVDDVEPGLYRWPEPLRTGDLRTTLLRVCWDQDLGRDAAFVVLGAIDLATLDDRGYRDAQLAAGIVEGRLHLAAYALGGGASGMTFLDTEIEPLLGEPLAGLLLTCVGVPAYRNKRGGKPGAPASVVVPMPGLTVTSD